MRKKFISIAGLALAVALTASVTVPVNSAEAYSQQAYSWENVTIGGGGGFIPGIIYSQAEKDLIYARTDIGGAYRWNKDTSSWIPLMDSFDLDEYSYYGIDSLAADPVDPNRVYAAAGMYTNDWLPNTGAILRSEDKGATWEKTELPFKFGGNMPGRSMGERLAVDPNKNSILYLGTRCGNGLWKSTDYGETWAEVASFPNPGDYVYDPAYDYSKDIIGVVWVAFDKSSSTSGNATKNIYVGVADKEESIYRSTDGGVTWEAVPGQPAGYLPHHGVMNSKGVLYITYSDSCGPYDGTKGDVWKYDTSTSAWTKISPIPSLKEDGSDNGDNYFGYGGLAIDAQNPDTIMVTSLVSWWPDDMIWRSVDGGTTWSRIWDWAGYPSRSFRYTQDISAAPWLDWDKASSVSLPEVSPKLGWMVGDIEIDPFNSDRMMYGTGATLYGTDNLTAWDKNEKIKISVKAAGIEETAVLGLISPPSGAPLISALGDIVGFRHDDLDKARSKMLVPAYSSATGIDYAELSPSFMTIVAKSDAENVKRIAFSYDGGTNWFQGNSEPAGVTDGDSSVAAAADATAVIWAPADVKPAVTTNNGSSWTTCTGLPVNSAIASDRVNGKKFYGFSNGSFYVSTDGGVTFNAAATGLPTSAKIKAVPGIEGDIWLSAGDDGLWHSTDSGATFEKLANVSTSYVAGFGKAAPDKAYMAVYITGKVDGAIGIFRSDNEGVSWVKINDEDQGFGAIDKTITGDPRIYGRVYVGTNGRGVIYGDISGNTIDKPLTGDVNGDKAVDALDFALIKNYLLGGIADFPGEGGAEAADVNGDGDIDAIDFALVKSYLLGSITGFPKQ
ncbi:dockerin type I repeat protein [Ruminiclostridium sufflavum DSM 19573]|uniref:cellulase n=1 Tax=Ruminiclostridium sufflavum DSM 19573 TaxID=1121337 RepID=A0A318XHN8_9FIRM|nr:dockerin type I domain-containing protein [Ruminiclostridium sufflavum]PYG86534.1 dockerin type I repeat protein [Ruminiclostridium sufflavum DSM 19573]